MNFQFLLLQERLKAHNPFPSEEQIPFSLSPVRVSTTPSNTHMLIDVLIFLEAEMSLTREFYLKV